VPGGSSRRYAYLAFFLPSFMYWPSALGKEAWSLLCLGLASYGVARCVTRRWPTGVAIIAIGLTGAGMLRPHVAMALFVGMVFAAAIARSGSRSAQAPVLRAVVFGLLFLAGVVLVGRTQSFFGVPSLNQETVQETLTMTTARTSEAGSAFTPVGATQNPALFPLAAVTVLIRPFPFEANNAQAIISSAEGLFIVLLVWRTRRGLRNLWFELRNTPYFAYSVGTTLAFIFAFSAFSNFGILARQRVQVMPFFFVLLCLPEVRRSLVEGAQSRAAVASRPTVGDDPYALLALPDASAPEPVVAALDRAVDPNDPYAIAASPRRTLDDDPYARFADDAPSVPGARRR
jgi:hypothetical protein